MREQYSNYECTRYKFKSLQMLTSAGLENDLLIRPNTWRLLGREGLHDNCSDYKTRLLTTTLVSDKIGSNNLQSSVENWDPRLLKCTLELT